MDSSKHDSTFEGEIAPSGTCSACHNWWIETGWARNLSEEEAYFNQQEGVAGIASTRGTSLLEARVTSCSVTMQMDPSLPMQRGLSLNVG